MHRQGQQRTGSCNYSALLLLLGLFICSRARVLLAHEGGAGHAKESGGRHGYGVEGGKGQGYGGKGPNGEGYGFGCGYGGGGGGHK